MAHQPVQEINDSSQQTHAEVREREIIMIRVFDASPDLVWQAWTDPKILTQWWGPVGFTTTTKVIDVRVGGTWEHTMHGPDGTDYPNKKVYKTVQKPKLLEYSHGGAAEDGKDPVSFDVTVKFDAVGNQTKVTMKMAMKSAEALQHVIKTYGAVEGGKQTLARLAEQLEKISADTANDVVITRSFDAPRSLVWKAWTDPEALAHWWGPKGCTIDVRKLELRPGGMFLYSMAVQGMPAIWGKFVYRELVPAEHMVFVNAFSDEYGGTTGNPWMPVFPLEILNDLTFTERDGKTTLVLRGHPINATADELNVYLKARQHMQQGFNSTFEKLDAFLKAEVSK